MKSMHDKKLPMNRGEVDSDGYFPEQPHHKVLAKSGELAGIKYPDTEEQVHSEQQQFVKEANAGKQKPGFRH